MSLNIFKNGKKLTVTEAEFAAGLEAYIKENYVPEPEEVLCESAADLCAPMEDMSVPMADMSVPMADMGVPAADLCASAMMFEAEALPDVKEACSDDDLAVPPGIGKNDMKSEASHEKAHGFFGMKAGLRKAKSGGFRKDEACKESDAMLAASPRKLEDVIAQAGENFQDRLIRLINERDLSNADVYKAANLDRKLFSKILCNPDYHPGKRTVLALAISLKLNLDETRDLLARAEYALSPGSRSDLIIQYFIENEVYDIFRINDALDAHGEVCLGA